jgi:lipopolysaccharide cholinephosphotransferase
MTQVQEKLLDMLRWFHRLCVENNLRYYAIGGTMLGAQRHQGFIPWDDDIDVGMPREDIEKLKDIINRKNLDKYVLETPDTEA